MAAFYEVYCTRYVCGSKNNEIFMKGTIVLKESEKPGEKWLIIQIFKTRIRLVKIIQN